MKGNLNKILNYISIGIDTEKLNLILGGKDRLFEKGYYIKPTIFRDVPDSSKLAREEIFGPVMLLMTPFKTLKEAIARANDSDFGLASGILSKNPSACVLFVRQINAGSVWVNNYNFTPYNIPFGGFKQSGFGRDNGYEAVLEYTTLKSIYTKYNFSKF